MNKAYSPINWRNYPSEDTPINETNLNKMDAAIDIIDNRVVTHETTKLDKTTANTMVKDVTFDNATGIFTITKLNGSVLKIDTKLEKLAVNFNYDKNTQILSIILEDGTTQEVDLSSLITQYEFAESDTIILTAGTDGKVTANIKNGSITGDMLEPNYLANIKIQTEQSALNATQATEQAEVATNQAQKAKTEADRAEEAAALAEAVTGLTIDGALSDESVNPVQNKVIKAGLDAIQSMSKASLSTAGWYRVAKLSYGHQFTIILSINNFYSHGGADCYNILINYVSQSYYKITDLSNQARMYHLFTGLRVTRDTNSDAMYLEVYYNYDQSNWCQFSVTNLGAGLHNDNANIVFKAIAPEPTEETVEGVSIYITHDIPSSSELAVITDTEGYTSELLLKGDWNTKNHLRFVIALCNVSEASTGVHSYTNGCFTFHRSDGYKQTFERVDVAMQGQYNLENTVECGILEYSWRSSSVGVRPCTFAYNGTTYGGLDVYITSNSTKQLYFNGLTNFEIFGVGYYITNTEEVLNEEIYNSISYDNVVYSTTYLNTDKVVTSTDIATLENINGSQELSSSILEKALTLGKGVYAFRLSGSSYTGNDMPNSKYNYSKCLVYIDTTIEVISLGMQGSDGKLYSPIYNSYNHNTGIWIGWQALATAADLSKYLPIDGNVKAQNGNEFNLSGLTNSDVVAINYRDVDTGLSMGNTTPLKRYVFYNKNGADGNALTLNMEEGSGSRKILHTGNSVPVIISDTAPQDTITLWYDTVNKVIKRYVDGAWQQ